MKKYLLLLSLVIISLSSCKKSDTGFDATAQAAIDDAAIKAYIASSNIVATKDPSGLYYQILEPGAASPHPTASSNITVGYTGTLLDGTQIDSQSSTYSAMSSHGRGWQIGLSHIGAGGKILLIIPSGLAYGNTVYGNVPANSVLVYTITLQGFN